MMTFLLARRADHISQKLFSLEVSMLYFWVQTGVETELNESGRSVNMVGLEANVQSANVSKIPKMF